MSYWYLFTGYLCVIKYCRTQLDAICSNTAFNKHFTDFLETSPWYLFLTISLFAGIAHLCEGTCKLVEAIGKGLCNVMDVAVGFLKLTEMATAWVGSAINFILTAFRVNR